MVTATAAVPDAFAVVFHGTWKLICPGETKSSGAGVPFTVIPTLASVVGRALLMRPSSACWVVLPKPEPYMLASEPGEILAAPLAAFDTPPAVGSVGVSTRMTL